jgi:MFS transporter, DHA2 family, multidrug resistance protein
MDSDSSHFKVNPWLVALAVIVPTFMEVLDTTIVSVALPHIAGNLSASNSESTWVSTSYLVANAIILPASAWFASFFGRKRFLLACIMLFTVASFFCGVATSLGILVLARILQGAAGGALQPLSQAIMLEAFPVEKHGVAMAFYGFGVVIAPVVGPILGGWITDNFSWRWIFYINVPVGFLASWLVRQFVFDPDYIRKLKPQRIDGIGFGLLTLWLGTMQVVLDKGQDADWFQAEWICWFTLVSSVAFLAFVFRELRCSNPVADLRVLKDRNFAVSCLLISIASVLIYGPMTILPQFLQGLMGYSALDSGLTQMARGVGCLVAMPLAGVMLGRCDARKMITAGFLFLGVSSWIFSNLNLEFSKGYLDWPSLLQGIGLGFCMVPLMTVAMGMLTKEQMGNATGVFALARNLAGSIGISLMTTLVTRGAQFHQVSLVAHLTPCDLAYQQAVQVGQTALAPQVGAAQAASMADGLVYKSLVLQANAMAYNDDFYTLALICFLVIPLVILIKRVVVRGPVVAH